jgi:hypothetical protein
LHGDLETLYDAHAHRLYAHCWSLLGDGGAADALRDTLIRATRNPPGGDTVLGLHHLARTVCAERGAFGRRGRPVFAQAAIDPLLAAVGALSAGRREALLLSAGQWLEVRDIAAVLDISPGRVRELLHEARTALERFVLDVLLRGNADPGEHMDVIAAFEKGRLPHLLARRASTWAPAPLRDQVLAAADREHDGADREHDGAGGAGGAPVAATGPLVLIDSASEAAPAKRERSRRRAAFKAVGGVTGVAATVAAGLVMTWPSTGSGTLNAFGPYEGGARSIPVPTGGVTDGPGVRESPNAARNEAAPTPTPTTATEQEPPVTEGPAPSGGGATTPATTPEHDAPATSSAPSPTSRAQTPPASPKSPEPAPDEGSRQDNPLEPITDIVGHLTSPLLGSLSGR